MFKRGKLYSMGDAIDRFLCLFILKLTFKNLLEEQTDKQRWDNSVRFCSTEKQTRELHVG